MADELTKQQKDLIRKRFDKLSNNQEQIESGQLINLVQLLGQNPTRKQIQDALEACELEQAEKLTLEDCEAVIWSVWYEMDVENELKNAFSKFDTDGNGTLDVKEFKIAMQSYGETFTDAEIEEMLKLVDVDGDGKVNYEEFVIAMTEVETLEEEEEGEAEEGEAEEEY